MARLGYGQSRSGYLSSPQLAPSDSGAFILDSPSLGKLLRPKTQSVEGRNASAVFRSGSAPSTRPSKASNRFQSKPAVAQFDIAELAKSLPPESEEAKELERRNQKKKEASRWWKQEAKRMVEATARLNVEKQQLLTAAKDAERTIKDLQYKNGVATSSATEAREEAEEANRKCMELEQQVEQLSADLKDALQENKKKRSESISLGRQLQEMKVAATKGITSIPVSPRGWKQTSPQEPARNATRQPARKSLQSSDRPSLLKKTKRNSNALTNSDALTNWRSSKSVSPRSPPKAKELQSPSSTQKALTSSTASLKKG